MTTLPAIPTLPPVATLPATATLPDVATLPATATLPAVATLPATATLPAVATLPVTATLPTVEVLATTAILSSVSCDPTLTAELLLPRRELARRRIDAARDHNETLLSTRAVFRINAFPPSHEPDRNHKIEKPQSRTNTHKISSSDLTSYKWTS
ncbi:MAG: hypothetical protein ACRDTT_20335 [Pseudonocardiaceae bacterium]